jgi:hypothetical protein
VDAAFQQTLWSVAPISSGSEAAQGKNSTLIRRLGLDANLMMVCGIVIMSCLLISALLCPNILSWHLRLLSKLLFKSEAHIEVIFPYY